MDEKTHIWSADAETIPGPWIVLSKDMEDFEVVREDFERNPIYLFERSEDEMLNIAQLYISLLHFQDLNHVSDTVKSSFEFEIFSIILDIFFAFQIFDKERVSEGVRAVEKITAGKHRYDKIAALLEKLELISDHVKSVFLHSVYGVLTRNCWWSETPDFLNRTYTILEEVKGLPSPLNCNFENSFQKIINNLEKCTSMKVEKTFKVVSAYCFFLSSYYLKKELFYYSYLLIHRSLDLFFQSIAIENRQIEVKRDFIAYHDQKGVFLTHEYHRISLVKTYFDYLKKILYLPHNEEDTIRNINRKRNSLLLAHGVDGISSAEMSNAYIEARGIMKKNAEWVQFLDNFKLNLNIDAPKILADLTGISHLIRKA